MGAACRLRNAACPICHARSLSHPASPGIVTSMEPNDCTGGYHGHVRVDAFGLIPPGGSLLDVGGGFGETARALRNRGQVDRAGVVDMVLGQPGDGLDFAYSGDLCQPGLLERVRDEQGPFDTILALDFLEHLADPWAMVARLHGLLKAGGRLIVSVPNVRYFAVSCGLLFGNRWSYQQEGILDRTHLRFFVRDTAVALATSSGMVVEQVAANVPARRATRYLHALTGGHAESLLAQQYLVRVRNA